MMMMFFYKKKDATSVFYYIRTPPCRFSLSDELVLPKKWWREGGVGAPSNLGFPYMVVHTG